MNATDDVLAARLEAGDDDALAEAFDRYGSLVYGIARRVVDASIAEDVTQDVFVSLWSKPDRFDPSRGSLRTYLGVQAQRRAIDLVRTEVRRAGRELRHQILNAPVDPSTDELESVMLSDVVRMAVDQLPEEQRQVVELAYYRGLTYRAVAAKLSIPEGTAKSRLRLALAKLESVLDRQLLETS